MSREVPSATKPRAPTLWVVMGNDYPDAVFDTAEAAEKYIADTKAANRLTGYGPRIYWRTYEFPLNNEHNDPRS